MKLAITNGRSIHINYDNGVILSAQIGAGSRCDNYGAPIHEYLYKDPLASETAEIA